MFTTRQYIIKQNDEFYDCFMKAAKAATNLYNSTLFRLRQVLSALGKNSDQWSNQEQMIMKEISYALPKMNDKYSKGNSDKPRFEFPTQDKWTLDYYFMYALFQVTENPDYYNEALSSDVAQNVVYSTCNRMKRYIDAMRSHDVSANHVHLLYYYNGLRRHVLSFSSQKVVPKMDQDGKLYFKFPLTKMKFYTKPIDFSVYTLQKVTVKYQYGTFYVNFILDDNKKCVPMATHSERICAIDIGVNNIAAVTNNIGEPCLLFKGGFAKSANNLYNKQLVQIRNEHCIDDNGKIEHIAAYQRATIKRNNAVHDFINKVVHAIIQWCIEHDIDTIVVGDMSYSLTTEETLHQDESFYVQLPLYRVRRQLKKKAEAAGIIYIETDESYTSQASFLDGDIIPVVKSDVVPHFSGKRSPQCYNGAYNSDGWDRLYETADGLIVNADLNASANIARKALGEVFDKGVHPDLFKVIVVSHPDKPGRLCSNKQFSTVKKA